MNVAQVKDINFKTLSTISTKRYNIIGGKRLYNEDIYTSTIREVSEELGLSKESKLYKLLSILIPKTKDIIKCVSFNVYCIYFSPRGNSNYDIFIKNNMK